MVYKKCDLKGPSYVDNKNTDLGFIVWCMVYGLGKRNPCLLNSTYVYIYMHILHGCMYPLGNLFPKP